MARIPQCTVEQYEQEYSDRHLLHGVVDYWARRKPDMPAIINANRGQEMTWSAFEKQSSGLAMMLLQLGLRQGDFLATSLPLLNEHISIAYACFRLGVIHAPLDLRLPPAEVIRSLSAIGAKAYVFLGATPAADFRELGKAVQQHCPFVRHLIQFSAPEDTIRGAISLAELARKPLDMKALVQFQAATREVRETDGAQAIFTTGSTGAPKPALLSHRNITCQNMCLGTAFEFDQNVRLLVNLPPSHVAGQSEALMTTLFFGGTAITLDAFDAQRSLDAIEKYQVNLLGQIPAMFNLEWRLSAYSSYDLRSLNIVLYGGQQVPRIFLEKLRTMARRVATGLGLTEAAGFCTYTPLDADVDEISESIGYDMPAYPMTIREPMQANGDAGAELSDGEIGHVCFRGPQTFLGYVNEPEATARAISRDGYLYTGDMGFKDARGLHFSGRAKWVIKPAGNQVFPGQVEDHLCALSDKVAACGVAGVPHAIWSEAIIAFVERRPEAQVNAAELRRHARALASYMRPLHYVILEPGQLPLNRVGKVDYVRLQEMATEEAEKLRARGRWDKEQAEEESE